MPTPPRADRLPPLVCFSHLRWDFVYQRPQHLMSRFAQSRDVLYVEEPVVGEDARLHASTRAGGVTVIVPELPASMQGAEAIECQRALLRDHLTDLDATPTFWFQTPMSLPLAPIDLADVVIYDCMDELSAFHGAPAGLAFTEKQLLARADLVFTGGRALYEAKRGKHTSVHCLPSSIDADHFAAARRLRSPAARPGAVVGFSGVIDERMDVALVGAVADALPEMTFVLVGPVVKIDEATLPRRANIHYLGLQPYSELPAIMARWDAAIMPFAKNESTRFISPTKTPEYLAAGLPVVSTSIRDVVADYGSRGLVAIADDPADFAAAVAAAVPQRDDPARLREVDLALAGRSWDATADRMTALESAVTQGRALTSLARSR